MKTINCRGRLLDLSTPKIMAIVNLTPDSFYRESRNASAEAALNRIENALAQGADIIDLGACSTRPGADVPSVDEEWLRMKDVLTTARRNFPDAIISIDTFRSQIARQD